MTPDVVRPPATEDQVRAVKAVASGEPSAAQCKMFVEFVLHELCGVDRDCWAPTDRETAFALGRRNPGLVLREMILRPVDDLVKPEPRRRPRQSEVTKPQE